MSYINGRRVFQIVKTEMVGSPTGDINITTNGTHDVRSYANAVVNVPAPALNLQNKTATVNGVVSADAGYDGLNSVTVNVSGGSSDNLPQFVTVMGGGKRLFYDEMTLTYANLNTINFSNCAFTNMESMFNGCSALTTIPTLGTGNVTRMNSMFNGCSALTTIPTLDTGNVTSMSYMFSGCSALTTIPTLDTGNVTSMSSMFSSCARLTTIPALDTSNVDNMTNIFSYCSALTTIPALDTSNVTVMANAFRNCTNLKTILMTGMKVSFDISASTQFEESDLVTIINNLTDLTGLTAQTLTIGTTNLAKLTTAEIAIATNKNWTLA